MKKNALAMIESLRTAAPKLSLSGHAELSRTFLEAADLLESQHEANRALRAILTRTQSELIAAVNDMKRLEYPCDICANSINHVPCDVECSACESKCVCDRCTDNSEFIWRGPEVL